MTKGKIISLPQANKEANAAGGTHASDPALSLFEQTLRELSRIIPDDRSAFSKITEQIADTLRAHSVSLWLVEQGAKLTLHSLDSFDARARMHSTDTLEFERESEVGNLFAHVMQSLFVSSDADPQAISIQRLMESGFLTHNAKDFAVRGVLCDGSLLGLLALEYGVDRTCNLHERLFLNSAAESIGKLLLSPRYGKATLPLRHRVELEKISSYLTAGLALFPKASFESSLNSTLKAIGTFLQGERCFVHSFTADEQSIRNASEWVLDANLQKCQPLKDAPRDNYPWSLDLLKRGETVVVHLMDDLPPEAKSDKSNWQRRGVQSFVVVPLVSESIVIGCFGISVLSRTREWSAEDVHFLELVAPLIGNAFARQKAEDKAQRNEARLQLMIKDSPVSVVMFDRELRLAMASDRWYSDFDVNSETAIGTHYYDLIPDIPERWKRMHREVLAGAVRRSNEDMFVREDGSKEWVRWEVRPWHNRAGQISGIVVFREWITERKKIEEALRLYQFAMDRCADGVFWFLPDGSISYINNAACDLLSYEPTELLALTIFDLIPDFDDKEWAQVWEQARRQVSFSSEILYRTKDKDLLPLEANQNYLKFNDKEYLCCFARDVSERQHHIEEREKFAERLQQQQKFLRQVIDLNPNFVFAKDLKGRYTLVNRATAGRYNKAVEDILGKTDLELEQPEGESRRFHREDLDVARSQQPLFIPEDVVHIKGRKVWLQTEKLPIVDESGEVTQILGVATDISDRKLSEESRISLENRIQHTQKLESLGVLAGGIAHDFNNLLMGILGNAGLVLMQLAAGSPSYKRIERIKTAAERAADLTNQLLAYSGKGKFIVEPINLSVLVHEMMSLLETVISKKSSIICEFDDNLPYIEADATQIRQVVMNLITNASEALEEKSGAITVRTGSIYADSDYLSTIYLNDNLAPGEYAFIEVSDTGKGMSKETLSKIFDPFFTTKFAGRGLGLAGVLGIVRSHRGALKVTSSLGEGTTFRALFPAAKGRILLDEDQGIPLRRPQGQSQGLFLIVDDEELTLSVAEETLCDEGFEVITAINGQEGIDMFRKHHQQLVGVLLDMTMPIVDGEEALREMQKIDPEVPIILSSGYSEQDAVARVQGTRFAGFIQKPYLPTALISKIKDVTN